MIIFRISAYNKPVFRKCFLAWAHAFASMVYIFATLRLNFSSSDVQMLELDHKED